MSKRILSLVLALVMVLGTFGTVFAAESGNAKVDWLVEEGFVVGDAGTGALRLTDAIKRSEVTVIVTKALDLEAVANASIAFPSIFNDMSPLHWANGFVNVAAGRGFVSGYPNGRFMPEGNITYAEMASMLVRVLDGITEEEQKTAVWPTTHLAKAAQLGILDGVTIADFNAPAVREKIFEMVYNAVVNKQVGNYTIVKGIVLENYRVEKLGKDEVVIEVIKEIQRANQLDEAIYERGDQEKLVIDAKVGDVEDLLGKVADFTLNKDGKVVSVKVDESYKIVTGALKATKSKMGAYTVELPERYKTNESDERIFRTYFNNKGLAYEDFYVDPNAKTAAKDFTPDFAKITTKNGKVLFIDAFSFDDIAPVKEVKKDGAEVYVYNDARDGGIKKIDLKDSNKIITVKDGVFNIGSKADVDVNDVIHEFGANFIVRKDAQVDGTYNKVSTDIDKDTYVHIDDEEYYVPVATSKKPVYSYDSKEFLTLEADIADRVLREFKDEKVTALLDLSDNLQYIGSEIELGEFVALLNNILAKDIKVVKVDNTKAEYAVTFDSTLEVDGSTRYQNLDKFNRGDLVYLSVDDTEVDTMIQLVEAKEEGTLVQKDNKDKYMLSTNSITLETDDEYKVLDRTNVFIRSGNTLKGTTIEDVKKAQDNAEVLKAYVLTDKEYARLVTDARRDVSERTDVAHTIIFTKVTNAVSYDTEVAEIVRTYTAGRDVEIDVKFAGSNDVITRKVVKDSKAYDDIKAKVVNIGDIVELSVTKDDDKLVKEVELLIEEEADVYNVYSISSKTGYREIVLEGKDGFANKDYLRFWLDRDADVFGNLEEGTKVSYYSSNEDKKDNPDIEVIYVEGRKAKVTGTFLTKAPDTTTGVVTYIDKAIAAKEDVVVKLELPADNTTLYTVKLFGADGLEIVAAKQTTLVSSKYTAEDLGIGANIGTKNETYVVRVYKTVGANEVLDSEKVVNNVDTTKPTLTTGTLTTANVLGAKAKETVTVNGGDITSTAVLEGTAGEGYKLELVDNGEDTISVSYTNKVITVSLANPAGTITSTLKDVVDAVNANATANKFVELSVAAADEAKLAVTAVPSTGTATSIPAVDAVVTLVFSEKMKADTTATITINGVLYNATVAWDATGTTATLTIKDALVVLGTDGLDIKALVTTTNLVDAAGNAVQF